MLGWYGDLDMILLVVGLVAPGIPLARGFRPAERHTRSDIATEVLRRRYAAGGDFLAVMRSAAPAARRRAGSAARVSPMTGGGPTSTLHWCVSG